MKPLSRLPIPLWGVHAVALVGWIGFGVFLWKNKCAKELKPW